MKVDPRIFREYDIRGVAGTEFDKKTIEEYEKWYGKFTGVSITLEVSEAIGKAYGTYVKRRGGKKVVVGYEERPYALELTESFIKGVRATGLNVSYLGVALTPLVYFATAYYGFDGGVNITGSHNVYFFNGYKMMLKDVYPLFGKELQSLRRMVETGDFDEEKEGSLVEIKVFNDYKKHAKKHIFLKRRLKVVIDCGNGSAGLFAPAFLENLGCEVVGIYTEPDAKFPNHVPDPEMPQHMEDLGKKVREERADLGIGFDADGDRVGFVDENGKFIGADTVLLVLAKDILKRHPGKKILFDVKCTEYLEKFIPEYGGVPLMHVTGHAPIKDTMRRDKDVVLGGEFSGHFYWTEDYFNIDDGLFGAGRVLELFTRSGKKKFSELFDGLTDRVYTPEIKLPCADEVKFEVVRDIVNFVKDKYRTITMDGVRFYLNDEAWGLIRASNTSPYLTVRVEGRTKKEVLEIKNLLADELEKFPEVGDKLNRKEVATLTGRLGWV